MKTWNKLIPFCDGRMLHYEGDAGWSYDETTKKSSPRAVEWRPQQKFTAALQFVRWHHGRSAAYADFKDVATGVVYPVSLSSTGDFMHLLCDGRVLGDWLPMKRGQNYLLEFVPPARP